MLEVLKSTEIVCDQVQGTDLESARHVDLTNAFRFRSLVQNSRKTGKVSSTKRFGLPFSMDRPEADAAHRSLEEELKPAAKKTIRNSMLSNSCISDPKAVMFSRKTMDVMST